MNCEQGNKIDLVEYLYSIGHKPKKIRAIDYWYLSPLRDEKEASLKINRNKNIWYDHGIGKGGNMVDFLREYYHCTVEDAKAFSFSAAKYHKEYRRKTAFSSAGKRNKK